MNSFDNEATTLEYLTNNKRPDCVTALETEFRLAVSEGLGFREAYYKAQLTHFVNDHDGANNGPGLTIPETDEAVLDAIWEGANDEKATMMASIFEKWYALFRSWNFGVSLSFSFAVFAGREEWEDNNDLDEAEGIRILNKLPEGELKDVALTAFYTSRNNRASVYASLRQAKDEATAESERAALKALFRILGEGIGGSRLN